MKYFYKALILLAGFIIGLLFSSKCKCNDDPKIKIDDTKSLSLNGKFKRNCECG
jgi:hypothetical protein